jgi:hypothetical protein
MTSPDKDTQDINLGGPEVAERIADFALFFIESVRRNPVIWEILNIMPRPGVNNPVQYIDLLLIENFGGVDGANFKKHCGKENGEIDQQKLLDLLKATYKRIVDILKREKKFFIEYPKYRREDLAQVYQQGFRYIAGMYRVSAEFQDFINDIGVLENRTVEKQPESTPEPAPKPPERPTKRWQANPAKREAERGPASMPGPMRVGAPPVSGRHQTLRLQGIPQPEPPKRIPTLPFVSVESGGRQVSGSVEDTSRKRKSSIPLLRVMDEIRSNNPTFQEMPAPSIKSMEEDHIPARRKTDRWMPGTEYSEVKLGDHRDSFPPNLDSRNPPPPKPSHRSDGKNLTEEMTVAMAAMEQLANDEFRRQFIREYRILALHHGVKDTMDQRFIGLAVENVIKLVQDMDGSDPEAPFRNFRVYYCAATINPEERSNELTELARKILLEELPELKSRSFNQLRSEFIADFQARYWTVGDKPKKKEMFLPVFEETIIKLNKRLKNDRDKFESYALYYPSGHMAEVKTRAMAIAAENASFQLANLEVPVEAYLDMVRDKFEHQVVSVDQAGLNDLIKTINWIILEWLYKKLPQERGPRIWLNYFFQGQTRPDKLQIKDADEKLELISDQTYGHVKEYCEWLRNEAAKTAGTAQAPAAGEDRVDIESLMSGVEGSGSQVAAFSCTTNAAMLPAQTASEPVSKITVSENDQQAQAQEFSNIVDVLSKWMPGRGPMGSMPPEANTDGDGSQVEADMHFQAQPLPSIETPAPTEGEVLPEITPAPEQPEAVPEQPKAEPEQVTESPEKQKSWLRRNWLKIVKGVSLAAAVGLGVGALGVHDTKSRSSTDSTEKNTAASAAVGSNKGPQTADSAKPSEVNSASMAQQKAPETPKTQAQTSPEKTATGDVPTVTPEMVAAVKNPELKKIMTEGKFEVKANGGGYGQQLRAYFDAEINYKIVNREITPEQAKDMTRQLDELQKKINTGAALSYYDKYSKLSYGEVYAKRANPGKDSLFAYCDRNIKNSQHQRIAGMGNFETWREYESLTKMAGAQDAKKYFEERYEGAMLNFTSNPENKYDQRAHGNIHWGAQGGDKRLVQNEKGEWLPYFADMANIVLKGQEKPVNIDLDQQWTDEPANGANHAPAVNPAKGTSPEVAPMDGGIHDNGTIDGGFGKTGLLNNHNKSDDDPTVEVTGYTEMAEDREIEVTWTDVEDPEVTIGEEVDIDLSELDDDDGEITMGETDVDLSDLEETAPEIKVPTLEEKIAAVKKNRRHALLERGEVFVPSLSEDMDGSVKLAYENGFLMMCTNGLQQDKVEALARNIRFNEMIEYEATEYGTYARLSPEKLAQLQEALGATEKPASRESAQSKKAPAVVGKSSTLSPEVEAELAEIEDGWLDVNGHVDKNPMDVQFGIRNGLNDTVPGVIKYAA